MYRVSRDHSSKLLVFEKIAFLYTRFERQTNRQTSPLHKCWACTSWDDDDDDDDDDDEGLNNRLCKCTIINDVPFLRLLRIRPVIYKCFPRRPKICE